MRCEQLMNTDVAFVRPSEDVRRAAMLMRSRNVGFLPVCSDERKVVGVITDRDIAVRCVAEGRPVTTEIREVMTREIVACRPEDDIETAGRAMIRHQRSRIVCLGEHQYLLGVISLSDLSRAGLESGAAAVLERVSERESAPPRWAGRPATEPRPSGQGAHAGVKGPR
ncbi:MAG: hypothetical protein BGO98_10395 [Myxococcales bacterium 68-20]|nr:CBS domain-containing protein [Myxococcales bacterium]OJY18060.1 MAG: hypothetical protein BGO98_10395 [Myxococcales bacterium 68-20]